MTREFKRSLQADINRIEKNDFAPDTVRNLLTTFRNDSHGRKLLKEIGNALAHKDSMQRGLFRTKLLDFYQRGIYPSELQSNAISIEDKELLDQLIIHQPYGVFKKFKVEVGRIQAFIKKRLKRFGSIYKLETHPNFDANEKKALDFINYCVGNPLPSIKGSEVIDELIMAIKVNGLVLNEVAFRKRSNQISLSILHLMNGMEIKVVEGVNAIGRIKGFKEVGEKLRIEALVPHKRELVPDRGSLLRLYDSGESNAIYVELFSTDLEVLDYLDETESRTNLPDTSFSDNDFVIKNWKLATLPYEGEGKVDITFDNLMRKAENGDFEQNFGDDFF